MPYNIYMVESNNNMKITSRHIPNPIMISGIPLPNDFLHAKVGAEADQQVPYTIYREFVAADFHRFFPIWNNLGFLLKFTRKLLVYLLLWPYL